MSLKQAISICPLRSKYHGVFANPGDRFEDFTQRVDSLIGNGSARELTEEEAAQPWSPTADLPEPPPVESPAPIAPPEEPDPTVAAPPRRGGSRKAAAEKGDADS
jgi:hypothetical protein